MKIDMRMNLKLRKVELKTTDKTGGNRRCKVGGFYTSVCSGIRNPDAVALLRLDDLYLEGFEVKDVKQTLRGEHMSRGIGRLSEERKTKYTIETPTRTRTLSRSTHTHIRVLSEHQSRERRVVCINHGFAPGKSILG